MRCKPDRIQQRATTTAKRLELRGTLASNAQTGTCEQLHSIHRQGFLPDAGPAVTSLLGRVDAAKAVLKEE